jgi:tetratricopeptide (TPR) repeat protein
MKKIYILFILLIQLLLGCGNNSKQQALEVFNQGIALSLQATNLHATADTVRASSFNRKAILKFREALKLDPTHPIARAAIGHSYYLLDDFPTAIRWFEASNKIDTASVASYRELGLSRIGTGAIDKGWADLRTAFRLDSVNGADKLAETKHVTVSDLLSLGQQVFSYGEAYTVEDEPKKGRDYQEVAVNMLLIGYSIEPTRKDVAKVIAAYAQKLKNERLRAKYAQLAQ